MSQKTPSPTGEEEHTTEETNPPQTTKGGRKQQTQHTPTQQGHTRPTKNGAKQMASIFGTLLSSQGSGAHRIRPSGHPSGRLCAAVSLYSARVEEPSTVRSNACPVWFCPAVEAESLL